MTVCSFMIFHMPDEVRQRGLREIFRVLRADGTFLVVDAAQTDLDTLGQSMAQVGFATADSGIRKVARLAPSVRYLRTTAHKDRAATETA